MSIDSSLSKRLAEELEGDGPLYDVLAEMDPNAAETYILLSQASKKDGQLTAKERALINIAIAASVCDLKESHTRHWIAAALKHGASKEEIQEVLELTSVLGIHGLIPGVQIMVEKAGGLAAFKAAASPERRRAAEEAAALFSKLRGIAVSPVWEANCYACPDLVTAYARYSSVPWQTNALPPKVKEFVYIAIDLSPSHLEISGAAAHINTVQQKYGASDEEIYEVFKLIALVGYQTQILALPILKQELARR